jgi:hypothetical protein
MPDPAADIMTMAERRKARIFAFSGEWRGGTIGYAGDPGEYASDGCRDNQWRCRTFLPRPMAGRGKRLRYIAMKLPWKPGGMRWGMVMVACARPVKSRALRMTRSVLLLA